MAYKPQEWVDGKDGGTPLSADRLNHIEQGIAEHSHDADDVSSGTFAAARIPTLGLSKVNGLSDRLTAIEARLDALEGSDG